MNNTGVPVLQKQINFKDYLPVGVNVISHVMPWFGQASHKNVPNYDSRDPNVCLSQCNLMKTMGIDTVNVDWYGPDKAFENEASLELLRACETTGLRFSICIDGGAFKTTADLQDCLKYVTRTFTPSLNYYVEPVSGKPIVNLFGNSTIDLTSFKPSFFFVLQDGWMNLSGEGVFGWINPTSNPNDINTGYLSSFISLASNSTKTVWYPVYTGFDDSQAAWGMGRKMNRRNGLTLLDTLSLVPPTAKNVILCTWNDYEEGTAMEASQG